MFPAIVTPVDPVREVVGEPGDVVAVVVGAVAVDVVEVGGRAQALVRSPLLAIRVPVGPKAIKATTMLLGNLTWPSNSSYCLPFRVLIDEFWRNRSLSVPGVVLLVSSTIAGSERNDFIVLDAS